MSDRNEKVISNIGDSVDCFAPLREFADATGKVNIADYLAAGGDPVALCGLRPGGVIPPARPSARRLTEDDMGVLRVYRATADGLPVQGRPLEYAPEQRIVLSAIIAHAPARRGVERLAREHGWSKAAALCGFKLPGDAAEWAALAAHLAPAE